LPVVAESAHLRMAMKHNALREFYPRRPRQLMQGAVEIERAMELYRAEERERLRLEQSNG
jgi:hypothetical protein